MVHTLVVNSASVVYGLAATSNGKFVVTGILLSLLANQFFCVFIFFLGNFRLSLKDQFLLYMYAIFFAADLATLIGPL